MLFMLLLEIKGLLTTGRTQNEPYTFTHYLILTRTYRLTPEQLQELEATAPRPSKRHKNREPLPTANNSGGPSTYSFHPEDEYIQKVSLDRIPSFYDYHQC